MLSSSDVHYFLAVFYLIGAERTPPPGHGRKADVGSKVNGLCTGEAGSSSLVSAAGASLNSQLLPDMSDRHYMLSAKMPGGYPKQPRRRRQHNQSGAVLITSDAIETSSEDDLHSAASYISLQTLQDTVRELRKV